MSNSEKLEKCKKEIRSILISFQKGCYLTEFNRTYRGMIGSKLPSKEFGYRSDIDFLYSMPDVVYITPAGNDMYHLQGIADEKSKHIQKMVCKQKPAKLKGPPVRTRLRVYVPPPRLSEPSHRTSRTISYRSSDDSSNSARKLTETKPVPSSKSPSPKEEIVSLVKDSRNGVALSDLLSEYEKMYNKSFSLEKYGFSSLEECLEHISEFHIVDISGKSYVVHESSNIWAKEVNDTQKLSLSTRDLQSHDEKSKVACAADSSFLNFNYSQSQSNATGSLPQSIYQKFEKVAKKYPLGIRALDFPFCFQEANGTAFDLHSLGYNSLADCIDDYSDIFTRKHVAGSKKDYIIYPADEFTSDLKDGVKDNGVDLPPVGALFIDHIILNVRKILEAYSEGIKLQDFLHVYGINCKDSLHVQNLGFSDLETFLTSIKDCVPLRFESLWGMKTIYLRKNSDSPVELPNPSAFVCQEEAIPFDAAFPDFQYESITFPSDFDYTKYFPVYVSSIAHPGHLYIQLNNDAAHDFAEFASKMNEFYKEKPSSLYAMKNTHIKVGASCVALWPADQIWYRAKILTIPSMDTVQVQYIDYGTREIIPKSLLRYLRKEYTKFPAEALKCSLAFLKPPNNAPKWDPASRQRLFEICNDIPLMAKIEEIMPNGLYSILLCDTNGENDIYINDLLHDEGIADYVDENNSNNIPPSPEPSSTLPEMGQQTECPPLHPLQALQAQCFLQAFATVAPSFAQNEHYLKLFRQISMYCPNTEPMMQSQSLPTNPVLGVPNVNLLQPNANVIPGVNLAYPSALPTFDANVLSASPIKRPKANPLFPLECSSDAYLKTTDFERYTSAKSSIAPAPLEENKNCDGEIFEDDDDEVFQQFCQQVSTTKLRYVKRVILGDGYKIHIIAFESKPYASSGDISHLIWNNKEADYLIRRLQSNNFDVPAVALSEDGNEELFQQLDRYNVKGVQKTSGFKASILLYPLSVVIKILNMFGHPSVSLRTKLTEECINFNPNDEIWKEFSAPEASEPEDEENHVGVTDDDKIERLCLFDLLTMKYGIKCRRMKILNSFDNSDTEKYADEITKLEQMHQRVSQRITEIKEICKLFA